VVEPGLCQLLHGRGGSKGADRWQGQERPSLSDGYVLTRPACAALLQPSRGAAAARLQRIRKACHLREWQKPPSTLERGWQRLLRFKSLRKNGLRWARADPEDDESTAPRDLSLLEALQQGLGRQGLRFLGHPRSDQRLLQQHEHAYTMRWMRILQGPQGLSPR